MTYVIDTDPGADDALALAFAWQENMPIEAITVVYGNAALDDCVRNALMLRASFDRRDVPVFAGESTPLACPSRLSEAHGATGVGTFATELSARDVLAGSADDAFSSLREPTTLLCLGPLTNVAKAIVSGRGSMFKDIVWLGGVFWGPGNVSPHAEFNAYNDPHAFDVVLRSGIPLTVIPADVCRSVMVSKEEVDANIASQEARERMHAITDVFIDYYQKDQTYGGYVGGVMYDVLVVGYALDPSLFRAATHPVLIDCSGGETRGRTVISDEGVPCMVVERVDASALKDRFFRAMNA